VTEFLESQAAKIADQVVEAYEKIRGFEHNDFERKP